MMGNTIKFVPFSEITEETAEKLYYLTLLCWPKYGVVPEKAAKQNAPTWIKNHKNITTKKPAGIFYICLDGKCLSKGEVFPREIQIAGNSMTIMALAGVCTKPEERTKGYAKEIVKSAFENVDNGLYKASLFQTTNDVKPFYEKLGAMKIKNKIINSLSENPNKYPFWNEAAMVYSPHFKWPEGTIDLLGPGY